MKGEISGPAESRSTHYGAKIAQAETPMAQLAQAFDYLRAAARSGGVEAINQARVELVAMAERLDGIR